MKEDDKNLKSLVAKEEKSLKPTEKISAGQMIDILDKIYEKAINGIPKVSKSIDKLAEEYLKKNKSVEEAAQSLIHNSIVKSGTSGFVTGFGGFATMIATLPANLTSVILVQIRMCCGIAKMAGYDVESDQVKTMVYACLTGNAFTEILKEAGITITKKVGLKMVKGISGKTLTAINKKVGFRLVTKFGEKGLINLGKVIPVAGALVGGAADVASTRLIGNNAYKIFLSSELPENMVKGTVISKEIEDIVEEV